MNDETNKGKEEQVDYDDIYQRLDDLEGTLQALLNGLRRIADIKHPPDQGN